MELSNKFRTKGLEIASKYSLELVDIKLINGKEKTLSVILDKKGGISLDDITKFTEDFNEFLDQDDELNFAYNLDCSSPGAERFIQLENIDSYLNEYMEISYLDKKVCGTLVEINQDDVLLKYFLKGQPKKALINKKDIKTIQLKIKF